MADNQKTDYMDSWIKQENINTRNKAIGIFEGLEFDYWHAIGETICVYKWYKVNDTAMKEWRDKNKGFIPENKEELKHVIDIVWYNIENNFDGLRYHHSWEELMPVVKMIKEIEPKNFTEIDEPELISRKLKVTELFISDPIKKVWEEVSDFCKWAVENGYIVEKKEFK